jgi:hypothetical protein
MNPCLTCQSLTSNPKFCGKSCAAKYNNKKYQKRKLERTNCSKCGDLIGRKSFTDRRILCNSCNPSYVDWDNLILEEVKGLRRYQKHSVIRSNARRKYFKANPESKCKICGYNKHVEVCHIKPIHTYSLDTKVGLINSLDNLVGLCPNHHWEFDNSHLEFTEFEGLHS